MKKLFTLFLFFICVLHLYATHNRAGEITYKHISGLTYQFTITTYTKTSSKIDKPYLAVTWGDNKTDSVALTEKIELEPVASGDLTRSKYVMQHTYTGPGIFTISFNDPNRNDGIINVPNSVNTPFYVESVLVINPFLGYNNSPVLQQPPIDNGCTGYPFIHNPGAVDPDGDSLSYRLVECKGVDGKTIPLYTYPAASISFSLNAITGDLIWDSPIATGEYNMAFLIEEWRDGVLIGSVERDMQVDITACNDIPPVIALLHDVCVEADSLIRFVVKATDANKDVVTLTATGSPFQNKAQFVTLKSGTNNVSSQFSWDANCTLIRNQPYQLVFKAVDLHHHVSDTADTKLADIKSVSIKIIGPSPKNVTAVPIGNSIVVTWNKNTCGPVVGYNIYRKLDAYPGTIECPCTAGVPSFTGYTLIKNISDPADTTFTDDEGGKGLVPGTRYCYIITAVYKDGAESCASAQVCGVLKKDLPIITNVNITNTDAVNGTIKIAWSKPTELDTVAVKGPFRYVLYSSNDFLGASYVLVDTLGRVLGLNDTLYTHINVNTVSTPHSYRISLYSLASGTPVLIGKTQVASSIFLSISPTDNRLDLSWKENVPWTNHLYVIYKRDNITLQYDSIGTSTTPQFSDLGLLNGATYCYKIQSIGSYTALGLVNPILNFSQEICQVPIDNVPPCPPTLSIYPDCNLHQNLLTWNDPNKSCADDVEKYNIYYTPLLNGEMNKIITINFATDTSYLINNMESIAGCYVVTAIDSTNNESKRGDTVCVDNCPVYELPNVFTPNNDGLNDLFGPFPYRYVKDVDVSIYDRWGLLVFKTNNVDIKWDGKNLSNKRDCADGVYFYVCDVNEIHLEGIKIRTLKGSISLIRSPGKTTE